MGIIHNQQMLNLIKDQYTIQDIQSISYFLHRQGVFNFRRLNTGLFPAAAISGENQYTGYSSVWIRDNMYVAYAHYVKGELHIASQIVQTLIQYFQKQRERFEKIIDGLVDPHNVMERPHIRFDGEQLEEIDQQWEHAQNDAIGYFLWFSCYLIKEGIIQIQQEIVEIFALLSFYFQKIAYWEDEDSGHWEEARKIEASSIGVVVAGLKLLRQLYLKPDFISYCCQYKGEAVTIQLLDNLIANGLASLDNILPAECVQPLKSRRYDAALLFLIYPLQIVEGEMADRILSDVNSYLQGEYGIRRYLGDSFWCRDYRDLPEEIRTSISIEREQWLSARGRALKEGEEAQWCIFDPIVSAIYGLKFQKNHQLENLQKQIKYLNRTLGQVTGSDCNLGEFKCPELYYLQDEQYIPNDSTPLLWTQANLMVALKVMEQSLA